MRKVIFVSVLLTVLASPAIAQDYNTALGFRGGLFAGVTVKHFIGKNTAIEGIASTRWRGFDITGLYEIHNPAFGIEGLNWYYGGGGHIGFYDGTHAYWASTNTAYTVIGIDGIIGIEYVFRDIPLNISLDWKPALNIIGHSAFWPDNGAVSVRYIF